MGERRRRMTRFLLTSPSQSSLLAAPDGPSARFVSSLSQSSLGPLQGMCHGFSEANAQLAVSRRGGAVYAQLAVLPTGHHIRNWIRNWSYWQLAIVCATGRTGNWPSYAQLAVSMGPLQPGPCARYETYVAPRLISWHLAGMPLQPGTCVAPRPVWRHETCVAP